MQYDATTRLQLIHDQHDRLTRDYQLSQLPPGPDDQGPRRPGALLVAFAGRRRWRRTPERALA